MKVPEQALRLKCKRRAEELEESVVRNNMINDSILERDLAFLKGLLGEQSWVVDYYNARNQEEDDWVFYFAIPEHQLIQLRLDGNKGLWWAYYRCDDWFEDAKDLADALIGAEK